VFVARNLLGEGPASTISSEQPFTTLNATSAGLATTSSGRGTGLTLDVTGDGTKATAVALNAGGRRLSAGRSDLCGPISAAMALVAPPRRLHVATIMAVANTDTTAVKIGTIKAPCGGRHPLQVATVATATAGPLTG
jgi:hypothetical protein